MIKYLIIDGSAAGLDQKTPKSVSQQTKSELALTGESSLDYARQTFKRVGLEAKSRDSGASAVDPGLFHVAARRCDGPFRRLGER
ncbi:MAG: hypothetical protein B9S32_11915 [Verrucomicrobia bacterium Tous-C9LFEB]|nr:MAG: hypothetical protein B9S32_11915 [Verrucomicrobia bacterium Tous-C9LFEB]